MGNKLGLLVPGVRRSGNLAKMAEELATRKLGKRKAVDDSTKSKDKRP